MLLGICGAIVVGAAATTAFAWPGFAFPDPEPEVVSAPTPTPSPTLSPADRRGEQTELTDALPDVVITHVLARFESMDEWHSENRAIESWTASYSDGDSTIRLDVGQWATDVRATSFFDAQLRATGSPVESGNVVVGAEVGGRYALFEAGTDPATGETQGVLWWRNGTVVFRATGPLDSLQPFYSAFPL